MRCSLVLVVVLSLLWFSPAIAAPLGSAPAPVVKTCTELDSNVAVVVTAYLDSWKNMYSAYKQFKQCDDSLVSEGFSDAEARLLADHWEELNQILPIVAIDPGFQSFVIRHVAATSMANDLHKIDHLSQTICPANAKDLCEMIHTRIQSLH